MVSNFLLQKHCSLDFDSFTNKSVPYAVIEDGKQVEKHHAALYETARTTKFTNGNV